MKPTILNNKQEFKNTIEENSTGFSKQAKANDPSKEFIDESEKIRNVNQYDYSNSCSYCLNKNPKFLAKCIECDLFFCNGVIEGYGSHLVIHLIKKQHKKIQLHKNSALGNINIECIQCSNSNIFFLGFAPYPGTVDNDLAIFCRNCNAVIQALGTHH